MQTQPFDKAVYSRTPHGVRGLKLANEAFTHCEIGRTPHGVRGLK